MHVHCLDFGRDIRLYSTAMWSMFGFNTQDAADTTSHASNVHYPIRSAAGHDEYTILAFASHLFGRHQQFALMVLFYTLATLVYLLMGSIIRDVFFSPRRKTRAPLTPPFAAWQWPMVLFMQGNSVFQRLLLMFHPVDNANKQK